MSDPSASITEVKSDFYDSAEELSDVLRFDVFEPMWWPDDAREPSYQVTRWGSGLTYRIGSVRGDGRPVLVLGGLFTNLGVPPSGGWSDLAELASWSGQVREEGFQTRAILRRDTLQIQLLGFDSPAQIVRVVNSFRRLQPN